MPPCETEFVRALLYGAAIYAVGKWAFDAWRRTRPAKPTTVALKEYAAASSRLSRKPWARATAVDVLRALGAL
jgi:hypothetical protein